jgi:Antimicrobial peptide resistance and lipid A acylation protein PagP
MNLFYPSTHYRDFLKFKPRLLLVFLLAPSFAFAGWLGDTWNDSVVEVKTVYLKGDDQLFISGHAHHGRSSYTPAKLATLNEHAWGLGWAKTLRKDGIHRGVYGFVISDSHKDPQYMLGYSYEKAYYFNKDWYIAAGVAPMIVRREDMFGKMPFPAAFPLVSIGNQTAELRAVYIPRLSKNLGNGDVLYLFGSIKY